MILRTMGTFLGFIRPGRLIIGLRRSNRKPLYSAHPKQYDDFYCEVLSHSEKQQRVGCNPHVRLRMAKRHVRALAFKGRVSTDIGNMELWARR